MPSLKQKQYYREKNSSRERALAGFFLMLNVLDAFELKKQEGRQAVCLHVALNFLSEDFEADDLSGLTVKLGTWLCGLPAGFFDCKQKELEALL